MIVGLSISGFIFCVIFLPLKKYAYELTSAKTMVFINTIALFSFVIPFYFIVSILDGSESDFIHYDALVFRGTNPYAEVVYLARELGFIASLSSLWLLGVISFSVLYIGRYLYLLNTIKKNKFHLEDDIWSEKFNRLKNENKCYDVTLIGCCTIFTPCTLGIKNRCIVIPSYMIHAFDDDEIEFILMHEFYHVAHRDLGRKVLMTLLNCLHWFNPLYYFLRNDLSHWMEMACDEEVTKNLGQKQRLRYCQLIIKVLALERYENKEKVVGINFTGTDVENYKRRMTKIMRKNEMKGIWGKTVVVFATVVAMISGNVVAKAADVPVNQMFSQNAEVVDSREFEIIPEGQAALVDDFNDRAYESMGEFVEYNFNDSEDITYEIVFHHPSIEIPISEKGKLEPRHIHQTVAVTIKQHKKLSNGSCKTTYYDGKQCTSCGMTRKGDVIRTITDTKCSH